MTRKQHERSIERHVRHWERVHLWHQQSTIALAYNNPALCVGRRGISFLPMLDGRGHIQATIERLRRGKVDVNVFSVGQSQFTSEMDGLFGKKEAVKNVLRIIKSFGELKKLTHGEAQVATCTSDIRTSLKHKRLAIVLHLTGASHLNDVSILKDYYDLGVRVIHPPFDSNLSMELTERQGLTKAGIRTVEIMMELGMLVDVAHTNEREFWQIFDIVKGPVIYSHGGCRSLVDHPRNLTDKQIEAIAEMGGVIGVGVYCWKAPARGVGQWRKWETEKGKVFGLIPEHRKKLRRQYNDPYEFLFNLGNDWNHFERHQLTARGVPILKYPLGAMVNHFDYVKRLVGADHVAFGPDFEFTLGGPLGLEEIDKLPNLTHELIKRHYSLAEVKKVLGGNFLKLFHRVVDKKTK